MAKAQFCVYLVTSSCGKCGLLSVFDPYPLERLLTTLFPKHVSFNAR